jgi:hypothetical protein
MFARKLYNKEFMQLFGDLDALSFLRITRLNWIGHVNGMDNKGKVMYLTIIFRGVD